MSKAYAEPIEKKSTDLQIIINNLIEIKNLIIGKKPIKNNNINIFEFCLIPEIVPFNEIKNKINKIFNVNHIDEIFTFLIEILNKLYAKEKQKDNNNKQKLKSFIAKLFENLNFFICSSIIYNNNSDIANKAKNIFFNDIIHDKETNKTFLYSYINIFNIKNDLYDYFGKNKNKFMALTDYKKTLNLISILNMQKIYSYEYFIKEKNNLFTEDKSFIYELYTTYNSSLGEITNLTNHIIFLKTKFVLPSIIKQILDDKDITNKINKDITTLLIEQIMIDHSSIDKKSKSKFEKEIISYYQIITNYSNNIIDNLIINNKEIEEDFKYFLSIKEKDSIERFLSFINSINNNDIINKYIDEKYLIKITKDLTIDKITKYSNIIKGRKNVINEILNNYNDKKDGIKIIKLFDLKRGEYDIEFDKSQINNYLNYKIKTTNNNFGILMEYGLIDEIIFNLLLFKLMKKVQKNNLNENDDKEIKLNEDEEEDELDIKNKKKDKSKYKYSLKDSISINLEVQKILCLYHYGSLKNFNLTRRNKNIFNNLFNGGVININFNLNLFFPEEKYEPIENNCLKIDLKKTKIIFIDNNKDFISNFEKYFKKSQYIGVDSEWREPVYINEKIIPSILQIANYNETCTLIIDTKKLENDDTFWQSFKNAIKYKIFIGYDFNTSDIAKFSNNAQTIFNNINIIDIIDIFQQRYLEKAESLSKLCFNFLGKNLCKGCQCSQWDVRPLNKFQLHYAALDALVCIQIFKKIKSERL